jgi:hypothetical protein
MNIYKITQTVNRTYEVYLAAVVVAETEESAKHIHPDGEQNGFNKWYKQFHNTWADPKDVKVELLGSAAPGVEKGVVLAEYVEG